MVILNRHFKKLKLKKCGLRQAHCTVFAALLLFFSFEDAEGSAREIRARFSVKIEPSPFFTHNWLFLTLS